MLTKPQANFLARAMERPITAYGSDYRVAGNLRQAGLIEEAGKGLSHSITFRPTREGLEALREYRSARWGRHGCMAYLSDLQKVEAALSQAGA